MKITRRQLSRIIRETLDTPVNEKVTDLSMVNTSVFPPQLGPGGKLKGALLLVPKAHKEKITKFLDSIDITDDMLNSLKTHEEAGRLEAVLSLYRDSGWKLTYLIKALNLIRRMLS